MPSTCTGWLSARGASSSGSPAPRGRTCGPHASSREILSRPGSLVDASSLSLLLRRRRLQIVEPERVLSEDFRFHAVLEVLSLHELVDCVRPLAVPVWIVRGVDDVVLADPADHVRDRFLLSPAREVARTACHFLARLALAGGRVPRALLELAVHVLHEERHPARARFHDPDPQALELLEEPAVDAADHRDHLLRR